MNQFSPVWLAMLITLLAETGLVDRRMYDLRATFASRANTCSASELTVALRLGYASTQILPTQPLDENTKVVIDALDSARAPVL